MNTSFSFLFNTDVCTDACSFVGDSAYPLHRFCVTPFCDNGRLNDKDYITGKCHRIDKLWKEPLAF